MFKKSYQQFINIIKYNTQVKLNYKKVVAKEIVSRDESTFLQTDEILPHDISFKINNWRKDVPEDTFVSTILTSKEQKIVKYSDSEFDKSDVEVAKLNDKNFVAIKKHLLFETKHYYHETTLDRLFSPFHILNLHLEQNSCNNSLLVFIYDNRLFMMIINDENEIADFKIAPIVKFDEIKDSKFYENEITGQKLFDEYYALKFNQIISDTISSFYKKHGDIFLESITILYSVKQLSDDDIDELQKELMLNVNYHGISLDNYIYELSSSQNADEKSFITPIKTKPSTSPMALILLFVITLGLVVGVFYYLKNPKNTNEVKNQDKIEKVVKKEPNENVKFLPNHIQKNRDIAKRVLREFDIIPYNALLTEMLFENNDSMMYMDFLESDTYIKDIKPFLDSLYKNSEIEYKDSKNAVLKGVVSNKEIIEQKSKIKEQIVKYIADEVISKDRVVDQLKSIFNDDTIVTFKSEALNGVLITYSYQVSTVLKNPLEFYELVEELNKELYSINIDYPLYFRKSELGIELEFLVQFNQVQ